MPRSLKLFSPIKYCLLSGEKQRKDSAAKEGKNAQRHISTHNTDLEENGCVLNKLLF